MLIDEFLPEYDFVEVHQVAVAAPAGTIDPLIRDLDVRASLIARVLFALRGMPRGYLTLDGLEGAGFRVLADQPGEEIVIGLIGKFWKPRGELLKFDPVEFRTLAPKGYAKAAWNFTMRPIGGERTEVRTETRVSCPDESSRRAFSRYWRLVRPFSGLIRQEILRLIKRSSEGRTVNSLSR
jgi:hypothetical protein